jgi:hypothetical protein
VVSCKRCWGRACPSAAPCDICRSLPSPERIFVSAPEATGIRPIASAQRAELKGNHRCPARCLSAPPSFVAHVPVAHMPVAHMPVQCARAGVAARDISRATGLGAVRASERAHACPIWPPFGPSWLAMPVQLRRGRRPHACPVRPTSTMSTSTSRRRTRPRSGARPTSQIIRRPSRRVSLPHSRTRIPGPSTRGLPSGFGANRYELWPRRKNGRIRVVYRRWDSAFPRGARAARRCRGGIDA